MNSKIFGCELWCLSTPVFQFELCGGIYVNSWNDMTLRGFTVVIVDLNETLPDEDITYKNPILGISVGVLCGISLFSNAFVLGVFALKESWDNKTKFDVSMVCSSLVIAVFFLPVCSYKLLATPSPHTSHVVCLVVDAVQGYCVLNHLLTSCVTSVWNFINVKFPLQSIAWFQPVRANILVASSWIFVLIYVLAYLCVVSINFKMGYGCTESIRDVPKWIHLMTVYGVIIPSVVVILFFNSGFLILASRHIRKLNMEERKASDLHSVDNSPALTRRMDCEVDHRKSPEYSQLLHRRFRRGRRLSLFLFLCIIVWLPTIATACIIAACYTCIGSLTLVFVSGISHSISSITPPIFFILNIENRKLLRKLYRKFKLNYCQANAFASVPTAV